jgi:CBS domain-containing protein
MKIENVMSSQVISCGPDDSLNRAAQLMWEKDCGCLPVVDEEGEVIGIITDRDICMAAYTRGVSLRDASVASAMSHPVISCRAEDSISQVEQIMKEHRIRRIPVLDALDGLVGMVTLGDLARGAEAHGLRGAITAPGVTRTLATICEPRQHVASAAE